MRTKTYPPPQDNPHQISRSSSWRDNKHTPTPETKGAPLTPTLISTDIVPVLKGSQVINLSRLFIPTSTELKLLHKGLTYIPTTKNGYSTRNTLQTEINNYHNKLKVEMFFHQREPLPHKTTDHRDKLAQLRTPSRWVPQNEDLPH